MTSEFLKNLQLPTWSTGIFLVLGVVLCFAGYQVFKSFRPIYGGVLGFTAGLMLTPSHETAYRLGAAGLSAMAGVFLSDLIYFFGIALTGGLGAGLTAAILLSRLAMDPVLLDIVVGFLALTGGILAVLFEEAVMILVTSTFGAILCGLGFENWDRSPGETAPVPSLAVIGVIGFLGLICQYLLYRRETGFQIISRVDQTDSRPPPPKPPP